MADNPNAFPDILSIQHGISTSNRSLAESCFIVTTTEHLNTAIERLVGSIQTHRGIQGVTYAAFVFDHNGQSFAAIRSGGTNFYFGNKESAAVRYGNAYASPPDPLIPAESGKFGVTKMPDEEYLRSVADDVIASMTQQPTKPEHDPTSQPIRYW